MKETSTKSSHKKHHSPGSKYIFTYEQKGFFQHTKENLLLIPQDIAASNNNITSHILLTVSQSNCPSTLYPDLEEKMQENRSYEYANIFMHDGAKHKKNDKTNQKSFHPHI